MSNKLLSCVFLLPFSKTKSRPIWGIDYLCLINWGIDYLCLINSCRALSFFFLLYANFALISANLNRPLEIFLCLAYYLNLALIYIEGKVSFYFYFSIIKSSVGLFWIFLLYANFALKFSLSLSFRA